jgi:hypothetical protein
MQDVYNQDLVSQSYNLRVKHIKTKTVSNADNQMQINALFRA